ncbi:uncharacterized protein N7482_000483 [Penicillium canariense]|uniref:Protein kinase domain-containing protein n=1 Tax=Penicillium canariense TaxID=189055 RepID=A0A9W9LS71_9EURO|nr:uncharacterized protein N7482_000483 [Penicillium canariense]KAJ5174606.1 hypothetical protein N7482_000483 [Penicillium canariense]
MAHPHDYASVWWPEDRIKAALDTKYIVSRLRPEHVPQLFDLPRWGEGLTSETYMEWILLKAGRLFLILDAIGIPDRIFALVDESCDDDDLPIAEQNVDRLCLSPHGNDLALDTKFFHTQWRYLVRGIGEGEHITYTQNEGVPVEVLRTTTSSGVQGRDDTADKVVLAGAVCRVFLRTQIQVGGAPHFFSQDEVLEEIRALRKMAHQHVISIYASYFVDDTVCALFTGAETDRTLHSFLTDEPPTFKRQPKEFRRQTLITWPHCLASALTWMHAHGHPHAAIRPSNILVDPNFHIYLGQFQALDSLLAPPRVNDLEAYQYSAPERWVRTAAPTIQPVAPSKMLLPSGGRTGRRKKPSRLALTTLAESPPPSPDFPRPDSAASKGTMIRIGLPGSPSRFSFAFSSSSSSAASSSAASSSGYAERNRASTLRHHRSAIWSRSKALLATPSITSSNSSSSSSAASTISLNSSTPTRTSGFNPSLAPSQSSSQSQSFHTWHSTQTNPTASDLFSLAAIILDIFTHLCKRSLSSFASHRSARNRSAGRGGGMADASFHLSRNAVQVQSWIALLEGDALKRCRRDRGSDRVFHAVPRMLMVLRAMLAAEPEKRPLARRVTKCFASAIREIPVKSGEGVTLHCSPVEKEERRRRKAEERKAEATRVAEQQQQQQQQERAKVDAKKVEVEDQDQDQDPVLDSSSVSEFDFGFSDAASDSETNDEQDDQDVDDRAILEEEVPIHVDRVSPQLSLPDLDVHIGGIEGLTFREN